MNLRRLTPSMSLLLAFESAARHQSYTRAATELSLTQSAVSRQVQALEAFLGITLFQREGRNVVLTNVGRLYADTLSDALASIRNATLQAIDYGSGGGTLRLALLPTFGSTWLLPRLHEFYAANPGVQVHIHSRIHADFSDGQLDAAICVGDGAWPELVAHPLLEESMVLIASPAMLDAGEPLTPERVAGQLLLQVASHPPMWSTWFARHGMGSGRLQAGPSFELTSHLIQAVRAGIGLVPQVLVEEELRQGQLRTTGAPVSSGRTYFLAYPKRNAVLPALGVFRQWLLNGVANGGECG
ncbi:LysR substrate-binding domain-containing protein [Pseudomonas argentinensis]|uniref:LysR substrate-binding domain-containing protein n=1 Tax=Phytopseudomonas argentinensis TaxID=289370 RepID=UPI0008A96AEC|nr:LysR substrate-binding domain-containing protein [Pseudomonas argentinensis]